MKPKSPRALLLSCSIAALFLTGCAAENRLVSQWSNPGYGAPPFKKIIVGASDGESAIRRNFEDEFAAQLRSAGVDAAPSYRYIPEDHSLDAARLKQAAKQAGADAAILTRPVGVEQKTEYSPSYYPYPAVGVFGPHLGATWYGLYGAPGVRRYDVYTSEATLYDVGKDDVVWTGTVKAVQPDNMAAAIKNYVAIVIKALNEKKLLR